MRKAKINPSFEHAYEEFVASPHLQRVIVGHLVIEAQLVELIQLKEPGDKAWRISFPQKVDKCIDLKLIHPNLKDGLLALNDMRNDFGHILGHSINYDDVFALLKTLAASGIEFSDDTIHLSRKESEEWYGFGGAFTEIFGNVFMELGTCIHDNGGRWMIG